MFMRYNGKVRTAMDLHDIFKGGSVFLCGGGPQTREVVYDLERLRVITMAMNNTGTIIHPHLWIGADGADYYSASILHDPTIMKFLRWHRLKTQTQKGAEAWKLPNMYFMPEDPTMAYNNVFVPRHSTIFWKNVFVMALHVLYKLGFRKVYCIGCGFDSKKPYCYETGLMKKHFDYNQNSYDAAVGQVRKLLPFARGAGFQIISCTPGSKLHDVGVPYVELHDALAEWRNGIPVPDTVHVKHPLDVREAEEAEKAVEEQDPA
jgi:hypothetical protein